MPAIAWAAVAFSLSSIGADQRGIDLHDPSRSDLRPQAGLHGALKDFAEPLFAPALADERQTRMVGQFMQAVAGEPANGDLNLSLTH
jgi:hypothetical protein